MRLCLSVSETCLVRTLSFPHHHASSFARSFPHHSRSPFSVSPVRVSRALSRSRPSHSTCSHPYPQCPQATFLRGEKRMETRCRLCRPDCACFLAETRHNAPRTAPQRWPTCREEGIGRDDFLITTHAATSPLESSRQRLPEALNRGPLSIRCWLGSDGTRVLSHSAQARFVRDPRVVASMMFPRDWTQD